MLRIINPRAAAADVGSESIYVSIAGESPQNFGTVTRELKRLRDYLLDQKVNAFAMEFTGVYWMPLYELLEQTQIEVCLVNGAHVKSLPGRKTDVADCMWLAELHAHGLLRAGFVPDAEIRRLRDFNRLRENHVLQAGTHLQQVQKALEQMNIKVHDVISDLAGVSGQRVVKAILAGERNPEALLKVCEESILKKKKERLRDALEGTWASQHLFALKQTWRAWEFCQEQIVECDREIEMVLKQMAEASKPTDELGRKEGESKPKRPSKNTPKILNLHELLMKILGGRNPIALPGLAEHSLLQLLGEVGTNLDAFPSCKNFTSWLGLSPGKRNSGKRKRSQSRKGGRAGQIFRTIAQTVGRSTKLGLGAFYRRLRGRCGGLVANKALARKIAEMYYRVMTKGLAYVEEGLEKAEKRYEEQRREQFVRMAKKLGYQISPIPAGTT